MWSQVVAALLQRITDRDQYVRQAAVVALGQVARKGDEQVMNSLIARLSDTDSAVRRVSCIAISQAVELN